MTSGNRAALVIADVQNDFCAGGTLPVPDADRIISTLNDYIAAAVSQGVVVYAVRDWHPAVTTHFQAYGGPWPVHCVQGTNGARFHPDLRLPAAVIIVTKGTDPNSAGYSAFEGHTSDDKLFL